MSKVLDNAVTQADDGWTFQCPNVDGDTCGEPGGPGFTSSGWPTKKAAAARGQQHFDEHKLAADLTAARAAAAADEEDFDAEAFVEAHEFSPMQELGEFRRDQGLVVDSDGSVSVEAL